MRLTFFGSDFFSVKLFQRLLVLLSTSGFKGPIQVITPPNSFFHSSSSLHPNGFIINSITYSHSNLHWLNNLIHSDLALVASFPYLIPNTVLSHFHSGAINLHPSLLPKYRGASPIQHALINADKETGVSVIDVDPLRFDVGSILYQHKLTIPNPSTIKFRELADLLAIDGAHALFHTISNYESMREKAQVQDNSQATRAPKIVKADGKIHWQTDSAQYIYNKWRAIHHQQPIHTTLRAKYLHFDELLLPEPEHVCDPKLAGQVLDMDMQQKSMRVGTCSGIALTVCKIKQESRGSVDAVSFMNGLGGVKALKKKNGVGVVFK